MGRGGYGRKFMFVSERGRRRKGDGRSVSRRESVKRRINRCI